MTSSGRKKNEYECICVYILILYHIYIICTYTDSIYICVCIKYKLFFQYIFLLIEEEKNYIDVRINVLWRNSMIKKI